MTSGRQESSTPFEDAPPLYDDARIVPGSSQLPDTAGRVIIQSEGRSRRLESIYDKYSCGNPFMEVAERLTRLLFFAVLGTYGGLTISSIVTFLNDDGSGDGLGGLFYSLLLFYLTMTYCCSLCCTFGTMICGISCLLTHFITNKVMNHEKFRAMDIVTWIFLLVGYLTLLVSMVPPLAIIGHRLDPQTLALVYSFQGITIMMAVIIMIWDWCHVSLSHRHQSSQRNTVQMIEPQEIV